MSESKNNLWQSLVFPPFCAVIALILFLPLSSPPALGEGMAAYGARMCEQAGIPLDECTLLGDQPPPRDFVEPNQETGKGGKAETLVGHATALCEEQGVPLEECKALPTAARGTDQIIPASSFLTVLKSIPAVDIVPIPAPKPSQQVASQSDLRQQQVVRVIAPPPARPAQPFLREVALPPAAVAVAVPTFREQNRQVDQVIQEPPPVIDRVFRESVRPPFRPAIRERGPLPPFEVDRSNRIFAIEERFEESVGGGFFERFFFQAPSGRCLRTVRFSPPPSYRFVDCF